MTSGMYEGAIQDLIDALGRLPGIGPKSAQRIAFHILQSENETAHALVDAIRCALFGPIPGKRPKASMRSWIAPSYMPVLISPYSFR